MNSREPSGIDTPAPEGASPPQPAAKTITIYTAKTIVTQDPGTPTAEAVAVMDGKILGVGTLDEVKGWVTGEEVEIDRQFEDALIVPGFIKAHMHPQITGVLWLGVYVGRFDRTAPDGTPTKGLETKEAVLARLKDAAAKLPDGTWLVAWGYQPEFYRMSPSPAPTSIRSRTAIRPSPPARFARTSDDRPPAFVRRKVAPGRSCVERR